MRKTFLGTVIVLTILMMCLLSGCSCKHEPVTDPSVKATCTETGLTEGLHCALCGGIAVAQQTIPAKGHTEEIRKIGKEATCTEDGFTNEKVCSACGIILENQTTINALGHTTDNGTCERCGEVIGGSWELRYYVDEFNMPTSKAYIRNKETFVGTFSNSATKNSTLYANVIVDKNEVTIMLYEYGYNQVINYSSKYTDEYYITIRLEDGTKVECDGFMLPSHDRIFFYNENRILDILKSGEEFAIYIENSEYTTTSYLFKVDASNFVDFYNKLW